MQVVPRKWRTANSSSHDFGAPLTITACTIIGKVATRQMTLASRHNIFLPTSWKTIDWTPRPSYVEERLQQGCVRFPSYVPQCSQVPRAFRCYPGPNRYIAHCAGLYLSCVSAIPAIASWPRSPARLSLQGADNQCLKWAVMKRPLSAAASRESQHHARSTILRASDSSAAEFSLRLEKTCNIKVQERL